MNAARHEAPIEAVHPDDFRKRLVAYLLRRFPRAGETHEKVIALVEFAASLGIDRASIWHEWRVEKSRHVSGTGQSKDRRRRQVIAEMGLERYRREVINPPQQRYPLAIERMLAMAERDFQITRQEFCGNGTSTPQSPDARAARRLVLLGLIDPATAGIGSGTVRKLRPAGAGVIDLTEARRHNPSSIARLLGVDHVTTRSAAAQMGLAACCCGAKPGIKPPESLLKVSDNEQR